jgi:hypothetical protein
MEVEHMKRKSAVHENVKGGLKSRIIGFKIRSLKH